MKSNYLLESKTAQTIYAEVSDLPIYDYHCHLSPKEIYEDKEFSDVGELMLGHDHYKWRLMRAFGIDEELITGNASFRDKFKAYAKAVGYAAGNPLYHWTQMELSLYFGIDEPLNEENSERIYDLANKVIREKHYSPRKLIEMSNVRFIATTDDAVDSLEYHELIAKDDGFKVKVTPSFRTDNLLLARREGYREYINKLSDVSGIKISGIGDLDRAIKTRLDHFVSHGCRFSDIGIPFFPDRVGTDEDADKVIKKVINCVLVTDEEYSAFLFRMYVFLGKEYKERNIVMQWHLAVQRNVNSKLFSSVGADAGGDSVGDVIPVRNIAKMLDSVNSESGLPETVIYTLNPSMNDALASVAYSFSNVRIGAAWWFCDHKDGIIEVIKSIARTGHIARFLGMLTDSRSFLSYSRHDYFRRILCSCIADWVDKGEYSGDAMTLARLICSENIKGLIEEK